MDINTAVQFDKINAVKVEEIFGDCLVNIEPGSFCIFDKNTPSNNPHYHNCFEMCLVAGGCGEFLHGSETYILQEGDVFIADPGVIHEIRLTKNRNSDYADNLYLVFFRISIYPNNDIPSKLYEEKMLKGFLSSHLTIRKSQKQLFSYLYFIDNYVGAGFGNDYGLYQIARNMAIESLFSLVNTKEGRYKKQIPSETVIDQAISYIGANLHRRIYLKEVAAAACTSERNLQLLFRKHMDKSVTEYINQRKTTVAAGYLKMNFKMGDVCNLIGINDIAQFSRLFKKYFGVSPKKYQTAYSPGGMVSGTSFMVKK